ncbi:hypothetical protein ACI7YT_12420 [Microbacterium sp. M]|uniref:hypothetical protein n=1 Tax=Microbacterium sp. M TaxID=3377125 RepID=UPI00386BC44D
MSIHAQYQNVCVACDGAIRYGDLIDKDPFTEKWMHATCPEDKPREVCLECFMEKAANGACGC